jgi:hypothetical protein
VIKRYDAAMQALWLWTLAATLLSACSAGEPQARDAGSDTREASTASEDEEPDDAAAGDAETDTPMPDAGRDAAGAANPDSAGPPLACAKSSQGSAPLGTDHFVANTGKSEVSSLTYSNVGASGAYAEVVSGWSKATGCMGDSDGTLCKTVYRKEKHVEGALAPFSEEMTFVFGGPIELYQLAVYSPRAGAWQRAAYWDRCQSEGLVFAGNKHWYECAGFVESYVSADGEKESTTSVQFEGSVAAGTEVHVMSDQLCASGDTSCGYSSGLPLHGFKGDSQGSKLFAVTLRMPIGSKTPAYWILPSQVVRSNQYGCNCRGAGSDPVYKGGCGELDVAEILGGVTTSLEATTTLYSFQDITGGGSVTFARPVQEAVTFVVIFAAEARQIAIRRLAKDALDFGARIPNERVAQLLADTGTVRALR